MDRVKTMSKKYFELIDSNLLSLIKPYFPEPLFRKVNKKVCESGEDVVEIYFNAGGYFHAEKKWPFLSESVVEEWTKQQKKFWSDVKPVCELAFSKLLGLPVEVYSFEKATIEKEFDAAHYIGQLEINLPEELILDHFMIVGAVNNLNPNMNFCTTSYKSSNPDVASANTNAFYHFLIAGRKEGRLERDLRSISDIQKLSKKTIFNICSDNFDEEYYLSCNSDVIDYSDGALMHFLEDGWKERRQFTKEQGEYFTNACDIAAQFELNPLLLIGLNARNKLSGIEEQVIKDFTAGANVIDDEMNAIIKVLEPHVDQTYYFNRYPDAANSSYTAVEHYCLFGWKEHRDPNSKFKTDFYLSDNPDVYNIKINPFYHYIVAGQNERRYPSQPGGYKAEQIWSISSVEEVKKAWGKSYEYPNKNQVIKTELANMIGQGKPLLLSFSHDNYTNNRGGVQFCISLEQLEANKRGFDYLHLSPHLPSSFLSDVVEDFDGFLFNVVLNGENQGVICYSDLKTVASNYEDSITLILHALQGHSPEALRDLQANLSNLRQSYLWLHDNFTLCPSYTLQRNDVDFCFAPKPESQVCSICVYGQERLKHIPRITEFVDSIKQLRVISPSNYTKSLWEEKWRGKNVEVEVIPHAKLDSPKKRVSQNEKIRVAFVGYSAPHKGWYEYELINDALLGCNIDFYHLSHSKNENSVIEYIDIGKDSTQESIRKNNIDYVLVLSKIPETFNLVCYEAIAAGASVICFKESGNIASVAEVFEQAISFENTLEIIDYLKSMSQSKDPNVTSYHRLEHSQMTLTSELF